MQKQEVESLNQEARNQKQESRIRNWNLFKLYWHYIGKSRNAGVDIFILNFTWGTCSGFWGDFFHLLW